MVNAWSGTAAQLQCNLTLYEIEQRDNIPTLIDVKVAFSNSTAVEIITNHLQSVLKFVGCDIDSIQLAETALSILKTYYFLNLAELCLFFVELKNGSRGQFVWGSKLNNQSIMVALHDFSNERYKVKMKVDMERQKEESKSGYTRLESFGAGIAAGIDNYRELKGKAKNDFKAFRKLFPKLPIKYKPETLWRAWGGEKEALRELYGDKVPNETTIEDKLGKWLCEFNARNKE